MRVGFNNNRLEVTFSYDDIAYQWGLDHMVDVAVVEAEPIIESLNKIFDVLGLSINEPKLHQRIDCGHYSQVTISFNLELL